jgi:hypothetical protein
MRLLTAIALLTCLVLTACADSDKRSGAGPFGGWYGGVSTGMDGP